jgi:hypothetical protein
MSICRCTKPGAKFIKEFGGFEQNFVLSTTGVFLNIILTLVKLVNP